MAILFSMELFRGYAFSPRAFEGLRKVLTECLGDKPPVFLCIGSDKIVGDSLAPIVAENLRRNDCPYYIYGGLNAPITATNCEFAYSFIRAVHQTSQIVLLDSMATRSQARLGDIVVSREYYGAVNDVKLMPDLCIYGVTSLLNGKMLDCARLRNVLYTANIISGAILSALNSLDSQKIKMQQIYKIN